MGISQFKKMLPHTAVSEALNILLYQDVACCIVVFEAVTTMKKKLLSSAI